MKERPIIFSAAMVRAILDGRKTQTRRVVKPQPVTSACSQFTGKKHSEKFLKAVDGITQAVIPLLKQCPYGQPSDRLWVREAFFCATGEPGPTINYYRATDDRAEFKGLWRPSIHMPRWASRILLEVTGVRVERVRDISLEDALAEGCPCQDGDGQEIRVREWPTRWFRSVWEGINNARGFGWETNPWVWVIEFKSIL